jgi:hypothetical protein
MFSISFICKDYTPVQAPYQIFIKRPARFGSPIFHSIDSDVDFLYLTCQTVSLLLILQGVPPGHEHLNIGRIKLHSSMTFI